MVGEDRRTARPRLGLPSRQRGRASPLPRPATYDWRSLRGTRLIAGGHGSVTACSSRPMADRPNGRCWCRQRLQHPGHDRINIDEVHLDAHIHTLGQRVRPAKLHHCSGRARQPEGPRPYATGQGVCWAHTRCFRRAIRERPGDCVPEAATVEVYDRRTTAGAPRRIVPPARRSSTAVGSTASESAWGTGGPHSTAWSSY